VVNGLPSSIYSTANTAPRSKLLVDARVANASVSPHIAGASTPNLIANLSQRNYFDRIPSGLKTPTSPLVNPFATQPSALIEAHSTPVIMPKRNSTQPLQIKRRSKPLPIAHIEQDELEILAKEISGLPDVRKPPTPTSPIREKKSSVDIPFRVIKPSLPTLEKAMSIALFFEQYYHALLRPPTKAKSDAVHSGNYVLNRARRLAHLESTFHDAENRFMSEGEKDARREDLSREENRMLRERRGKVAVKGFEMGRVIGHGAFGVVRIAREKKTGRLVAMKQVSTLRMVISHSLTTSCL